LFQAGTDKLPVLYNPMQYFKLPPMNIFYRHSWQLMLLATLYLLLAALPGNAQSKGTVIGSVVDNAGKPLEFVTCC
jgi:hypothetical protein